MLDSKGKEQWYDKLIRIVNSAICFSLAYIVITWGGFFCMAVVAKSFGFDTNTYYFGVRFLLNGNKWSVWPATAIYSTYPIFALFFGLLMLFIFYQIKRQATLINVFLVWCFVIGTSVFSAQGLIALMWAYQFDSLFYKNFAVVFSWWGLPVGAIIGLNLLFGITLFYFAVNYPKKFLSFSYSFSKVNKSARRRKYFIETAIVPFILGAALTTAVTYPMNMMVHSVYLITIAIGLAISWVALFYLEIQKEDVLKYKMLQQYGFVMFVLLLLATIFIKISWHGIFV